MPQRRLAAIDQRFSMPASPSSIVPSVTGLHERLQTFYVDRWPEVKVQRGASLFKIIFFNAFNEKMCPVCFRPLVLKE